MSAPGKIVILKQSGEGFNGGNGNGKLYEDEARFKIASGIAEAFRNRKKLGVSGITVVPGAGNIARGRALEANHKEKGTNPTYPALEHPDMYGRMFIFANAATLYFDLEKLGIKVAPMAAPGMEFTDKHITFSAYNKQKVLVEQAAGKVVVIAGGMGEDGKTSDYAAVYYAEELKQIHPGPVVVLKSTKFDGVFGYDPAMVKTHSPNPRYKLISAAEMLLDYERFSAIDRPGLQLLEGKDLAFHIYAESRHQLTDVLAHEGADYSQTTIGTIVVGQPRKAVLYD